MSKGRRYTLEFKIKAIKQITNDNRSVDEVSKLLGVSEKTLCHWQEQIGSMSTEHTTADQSLRITQLELELKRTIEERDLLKKNDTLFS